MLRSLHLRRRKSELRQWKKQLEKELQTLLQEEGMKGLISDEEDSYYKDIMEN